MDLVSSLAARIADNEELRKENHELRQKLNRQQPKRSNDKHLVITDGTLEGISATHSEHLEIRHEADATFRDCQLMLTQASKNTYDSITLVVGRSECAGNTSIDDMSRNAVLLMEQAKAVVGSGKVVVSSILPQLPDTAMQSRIEQMNSAMENTCKQLNITFIENDPSFRLGDGEINEGFLQEDGSTLNHAGQNKLLKNLHLNGKVKINLRQQWKTITDSKPKVTKHAPKPVQQKQRAPCWNCGESNHTSNICRHRKRLTCNKCGGQGHKSNLCVNH